MFIGLFGTGTYHISLTLLYLFFREFVGIYFPSRLVFLLIQRSVYPSLVTLEIHFSY